MKQKLTLRLDRKLDGKLTAVKIIKEMTGLSLRPAKDIVDRLCDTSQVHNSVDIGFDEDLPLDHYRSELGNIGIIVSDSREDNLNNILTNFTIYIPFADIMYRIYEGSYQILDNNILKVFIESGVVESTLTEYKKSDRDIENIHATFAFSTCIIEDNN